MNYLHRVNLQALLDYRGIASDQVRTLWSVWGGGEGVTFGNAANLGTSALFTQPGTYVLSFTMQYGLFVTNDYVTVTVTNGNTKNHVPYRESFEGYVNGATVAGLSGWSAAAAYNLVVTSKNYTASYTHGYPLEGPHELALHIGDVVSNGFENTAGHTNACVDMIAECIPWEQAAPPQPDLDCQFGVYVDTNQHLMAWHGQTNGPPSNRWTQLPQVHIGTNEFVRLTVEANYARSSNGSFAFRLWVNGIAITNPAVWYATANTNRNYLSWLDLRGQYHVDDLVVDDYNTLLYRRIDASSSGRGRVVPCGKVLVPVNTTTNFSITPSNYCRVAGVVVDGTNVGAPGLYTFTNVTAEHVLTAAFAANLTTNGTPEWWLNRVNASWTNSFDAHALEDSDSDGALNGEEYVAGTDATNGASAFRLDTLLGNGRSLVTFLTIGAGADEPEGQARYYSLESSTDAVAGAWSGVAGWTNILGAGQRVTYTNQADGTRLILFRGQTWLGE